VGKKINVFRENDVEHLKAYLAEIVREVIFSEEEEEPQPQVVPPEGEEAPSEKEPQAKDAEPEPEGAEQPAQAPEEAIAALVEKIKDVAGAALAELYNGKTIPPVEVKGETYEFNPDTDITAELSPGKKSAVFVAVPDVVTTFKGKEVPLRALAWDWVTEAFTKKKDELSLTSDKVWLPKPGIKKATEGYPKTGTMGIGKKETKKGVKPLALVTFKMIPKKGTGGPALPNPFATKSEITEKLFLVGEDGKPVEGTRGGKTYRQWSDGKGGAIELCACAAPLEEGGCGEFLKFEATENPETGERSEGYTPVAPGTPEYQACSDAQKAVLSVIDSTLAEWQGKAEEAAAIMSNPNPKGAAAEKGATTGAINKWMGEMGEVQGIRQLIAAGADAALYTDSEVKNDAVIFSGGKARELKVDSVSIKSSYGEHVNAMGSSALPDLDHIFEGTKSATIMGKEVNPDHFVASIFQIRNAFLKILGGKEGLGATAPAAKGKWQITPEAIKKGYYLPAAKAAIGKELNATQFKEYRKITKAEFLAIWKLPEFAKNASKRAPVFRDLKAKKVKFDQNLHDACRKAMEPMINQNLKALDGWIAKQAADVIDDAKVEWTAATDLMMVKADATNKGVMEVKYLTMEAQKDLLTNKASSGEKIIKEIIGLAPKTNISADWSIRGLQHGVPPKETREVKSAKAVDTATYLRQIGAEPEGEGEREAAPEEQTLEEKVFAILKESLKIS